ncbi:hypothetical protein ELI54_08460 [Rhizobium ruizarguesonis]|uniref:hypothetical protein n=1 Tax=Rhizobium ruizarguesonis TaxID=2081791 RepID=UPI00102F9D8F|nr:hypothetical protein [Rhizobium ruizarguesonis]TAT88236.1 hypothetical protein ELI54_08460 [Rhizobium ruizarguesonis]
MSRLFVILFLSVIGSIAHAEPQVIRKPVDTDYAEFLKDADEHCNGCEFALMPPGAPESAQLVYLRAMASEGDKTKSRLQAAYFHVDTQPAGDPTTEITDYLESEFPQTDDPYLSTFRTKDALQQVPQRTAVAKQATFVVSGNLPVDTSLLIRNSRTSDFVVEAVSDGHRFDANMKRLRERAYSQNVTIFDFTPTTAAAAKEMNVANWPLAWRFFSAQLRLTFHNYGRTEVLARRSKTELLKRLRNPDGGVVVLYAHSDGEKIWLDLGSGKMEYLTADDIKKIGQETNGRLPPVILLNCQTRAALAPEFLQAGSPFVATTDQQLDLFEIGSFMSAFAKALYNAKQDVIDAYFTAQDIANPNRLRPIAENLRREGVKHPVL